MRCSTWRGNDLTKLSRPAQLWVCPRFRTANTPGYLCMISSTGREPVFSVSFYPRASDRSSLFTILSDFWCRNLPSRSRQPQTDPEHPQQLAHQLLLQDVLYHPSFFLRSVQAYLLLLKCEHLIIYYRLGELYKFLKCPLCSYVYTGTLESNLTGTEGWFCCVLLDVCLESIDYLFISIFFAPSRYYLDGKKTSGSTRTYSSKWKVRVFSRKNWGSKNSDIAIFYL